MSRQASESVKITRSRFQSRRVAMLATFTALIFIGEIIQGHVLEVLGFGFGVELSDVIALIGLTFTGWYAAPFFAIAHSIGNPEFAIQIVPRDLIALSMAGLAIDRLRDQPWIKDQQWFVFFVPWAPAAATITAMVLDQTSGISLDSGLGFLQGLATSFPAAVVATFAFFALHRKVNLSQTKSTAPGNSRTSSPPTGLGRSFLKDSDPDRYSLVRLGGLMG